MSIRETSVQIPEIDQHTLYREKRIDLVTGIGESAAEKYLKREFDKSMRVPIPPTAKINHKLVERLANEAIEAGSIKGENKLVFAEGCSRRLALGYPIGPAN